MFSQNYAKALWLDSSYVSEWISNPICISESIQDLIIIDGVQLLRQMNTHLMKALHANQFVALNIFVQMGSFK